MIKQHLFSGYRDAKENIEQYLAMKNLNRSTLKYLAKEIKVGMRLPDIKKLCEDYMLKDGADSFWYWDVGAFVFAGDETTLSVSGREYVVNELHGGFECLIFLKITQDIKLLK